MELRNRLEMSTEYRPLAIDIATSIVLVSRLMAILRSELRMEYIHIHDPVRFFCDSLGNERIESGLEKAKMKGIEKKGHHHPKGRATHQYKRDDGTAANSRKTTARTLWKSPIV